MEFRGGKMTVEQITAILTMVKDNRQERLKSIVIDSPEVLGSVSPSLIQEARVNKILEYKNV